jgi:hypothetical protein
MNADKFNEACRRISVCICDLGDLAKAFGRIGNKPMCDELMGVVAQLIVAKDLANEVANEGFCEPRCEADAKLLAAAGFHLPAKGGSDGKS